MLIEMVTGEGKTFSICPVLFQERAIFFYSRVKLTNDIVSTWINLFSCKITEAVSIFINDGLVSWRTPWRVYIWCVCLLWTKESLKFFRIVKVRELRHFYNKIIQVSFSFNCFIFIIFMHKILCGNRRYKATRPSLNHSCSEGIELTVSSENIDLAIFIMAFDNVCSIFAKSGTFGLSADNS